jgi:hypothetical protein
LGAAESEPREVQDEVLTGRVNLDGASFERCHFSEAVLVYSGGAPPQIRDCKFEKVRFEFAGAAGRTLGFLQALSRPSSGLTEVFKASFPRLFGH